MSTNINPNVKTISDVRRELAKLSVVDFDAVGIGGYSWIDYATGWNSIPTEVATTLPGVVYRYTYDGGATYYRYIADDLSVDAFYSSFSDPVLSGLVSSRRVDA